MKEFPVASVVSMLAERVFCTEKEFNELLLFLCNVEEIHDSAYAAAAEYASKVLQHQQDKFPWIFKVDVEGYDSQRERIVRSFDGVQVAYKEMDMSKNDAIRAEILKLNASFSSQLNKIARSERVALSSPQELNLLPFGKEYIAAWWYRYYKNV